MSDLTEERQSVKRPGTMSTRQQGRSCLQRGLYNIEAFGRQLLTYFAEPIAAGHLVVDHTRSWGTRCPYERQRIP